MSDQNLDPTDLAMIAADDELLDLLGSGLRSIDLRSGGLRSGGLRSSGLRSGAAFPESAFPEGDEVTGLLAAWRADLSDGLPTVRAAAPRRPGWYGSRRYGSRRYGSA